MNLDPYIVLAASQVRAEQLIASFVRLYPDWLPVDTDDVEFINSWLLKLSRKPGLALSTGRTNSFKGLLTCCLLDVLGVNLPRSPRTRAVLAWAILDSPGGRAQIGHPADLDAERIKYRIS